MRIRNLAPDEVTPYPGNPRDNDHAVAAVAKSIETYGFQQPIVVDNDHVVVVGHTRLKAAQLLGLKKIPVLVADNLSPDQSKAFRIADNKTASIAKWDKELLLGELHALDAADFDLASLGFDPNGLKRLMADQADLQPDLPAIFQIVITCKDDADQEAVYEHCTSQGFDCKVLTL